MCLDEYFRLVVIKFSITEFLTAKADRRNLE